MPSSRSGSAIGFHTPSAGHLIAAITLLIAALAPARAADVSSNRPLDCTKPLVVNGITYDLSLLASLAQPLTLSSSQSTPPSLTHTSLSISLCSPLPNPGSSIPSEETCSSSTRICQIITSTRGTTEVVTQVIPLATEEFGYQVSLGDADGVGGEKNLEWDFEGPQYAGKRQKIEIEMVCDPTATEAGDVARLDFRGYDGSDGKAKVHWRSKIACPTKRSDGSIPSGGSGHKDSSKSGWGFFSWFFFLIMVGFVVYFALGTYQNHQRYGVAEIPHRDFWREAPYLVQDAGRHAWRSVAGQGGGRGGAYEPV